MAQRFSGGFPVKATQNGGTIKNIHTNHHLASKIHLGKPHPECCLTTLPSARNERCSAPKRRTNTWVYEKGGFLLVVILSQPQKKLHVGFMWFPFGVFFKPFWCHFLAFCTNLQTRRHAQGVDPRRPARSISPGGLGDRGGRGPGGVRLDRHRRGAGALDAPQGRETD